MTRPRLCPPRPRVVFAGGRAPACWRQQVRPTAAAPAALARLCGWMAEMAQETGPKLRPKPLLGTCLAEMVGDGATEAPATAETTPSGGKPRPAEPGAGRQAQTAAPPLAHETGKRRPSAAPAAGEPRRPSAAPAAGEQRQPLPGSPPPGSPLLGSPLLDGPRKAHAGGSLPGAGSRRATPELLARLAGRGAKAGPRTPEARRPPLARPKGQPAAAPPGQPAAGPEWAGRLAARVRQRALGGSPASEPRGVREHGSFPAPAERPADLPAQWREPLDGPRVPAGWLAATPAGASASRPPAASAGQPRAGAAGNDAPPSSSSGGHRPTLHPPRRGRRFAADHRDDPTGAERGLSRPIPAGGDSDGWVGPGPDVDGASHRNGRLEADNGEVVSVVNRFAPPQMADTLPPLRPPVGQGSVAMPVAAAASRRSARREEAAGVDDLDELAGKLRRILEEESRRHGIDI